MDRDTAVSLLARGALGPAAVLLASGCQVGSDPERLNVLVVLVESRVTRKSPERFRQRNGESKFPKRMCMPDRDTLGTRHLYSHTGYIKIRI